MKKQIPTLKRHPAGRWLSLLFGLLFTITASAQEVKVTVNVDRQPLEKVLSLLEQQTGYRFFTATTMSPEKLRSLSKFRKRLYRLFSSKFCLSAISHTKL